MKRPRRWLFNSAAALSLVLCLAAAVFWVRSYRQFDWVRRYWSQDFSVGVLSVRGRTCLVVERNGPLPEVWPASLNDPRNDAPLEHPGPGSPIARELERGGI